MSTQGDMSQKNVKLVTKARDAASRGMSKGKRKREQKSLSKSNKKNNTKDNILRDYPFYEIMCSAHCA